MIPFEDAIEFFWKWRLASICIEVQWFSREPQSPGAVRLHVDGLVSLVDPEGIVTISGDGREIEFDLRGCIIKHGKGKHGGNGGVHPLDPDASLQIEFPKGEICLVFPYRRAGGAVFVQQKMWQRDLIQPGAKASPARSDSRPTGRSRACAARYDDSSSGGFRLRSASPLSGWLGVPIAPLALLVLFGVMTVLAMIPASVPRLLSAMGYSMKMADPGAMVWAIQAKGSYYCAGSVLSRRESGQFLTQADALTQGYQPADGRYCGGVVEHNPFTAALGRGKAFLSRMVSFARRLAAES